MSGEPIIGSMSSHTRNPPWLPGPSRRRAMSAVVFLALNIVASVASVVALLGHIRLLEGLRRVCGIGLARPCTFEESSAIVRAAEAGDRRQLMFAIGGVALIVVTGIVWVVWQHRARVEVGRRSSASFRHSAGWGVGSWFVPIANLFVPLLAVREIWREADVSARAVDHGGDPSRSAWPQAGRVSPLLGWWWATWLVAGLLGRFAFAYVQRLENAASPSDIPSLVSAVWLNLGREVLLIAAAVLAILVIHGIQVRLHRVPPMRFGPSPVTLQGIGSAASLPPAPPRPDAVARRPDAAARRPPAVVVVAVVLGCIASAGLVTVTQPSLPSSAASPQAGPRPKATSTPLPDGWTRFRMGDFALEVPPRWTQSADPAADFFAVQERRRGVFPDISVYRSAVGADVSPQDVLDQNRSVLALLDEWLSTDNITLPAGPSLRVVGRVRIPIDGGGEGVMYAEQYFAIVDGTLYELVFRAPWARRERYARDFLRVAESLEVGPG